VVSFGGQKKEVDRYEYRLQFARKAGILRGLLTAIGAGMTWLVLFASYGLAFWYGIKLIMDGREECFDDIADLIKDANGDPIPAGSFECDVDYDASTMIIVKHSSTLQLL